MKFFAASQQQQRTAAERELVSPFRLLSACLCRAVVRAVVQAGEDVAWAIYGGFEPLLAVIC